MTLLEFDTLPKLKICSLYFGPDIPTYYVSYNEMKQKIKYSLKIKCTKIL